AVIPVDAGAAPTVLTQAVRPASGNPVPQQMTYADLHSSVKDEIREKLFRIQHGLCAYCEERVTIEKTKIEHFHPQNPVVEPTAACAQRLGVRNNELARVDVLW